MSITTVHHNRVKKGGRGAREKEKFRKGDVLHILGDYKIPGAPPTMCPLVLSYVPQTLSEGVGAKSGYFVCGV